jgi:hypothetical protein
MIEGYWGGYHSPKIQNPIAQHKTVLLEQLHGIVKTILVGESRHILLTDWLSCSHATVFRLDGMSKYLQTVLMPDAVFVSVDIPSLVPQHPVSDRLAYIVG